ncbi:MAG: hypothetical protein K8R87_03380 [Verrucomicrobia bacterium]|nr:hypothetical protein [Verrucomicrobiota bacterium]
MKRNPKKKKNWLLRVFVFLLIGGLVSGAVVYFSATAWIQNYLRSDACRELLARQIGQATQARCEIDPVSWSGWNAYSAKVSLQSESATGWKQIEAEGVQSSLDWSDVRRGVWHVPGINFDRLRFYLSDAAKTSGLPAAPLTTLNKVESVAVEPVAPSWIKRWLPQRTKIDEVVVHHFDLLPYTPGSGVAVAAIHLKARPASDEGAWKINGDDGRVMLPGITEPFRLNAATARIDARAFVLNDAAARWLGDSEVTARGELPFNPDLFWKFSGRLTGLDLRHVLSAAWNSKIGGVVEGDYDVSGRSGAAVLSKGKLRVKSGVIQALPLLERVADFTNTNRFRRIVLDEATGDVEVQRTRTRLMNLVLQSNGLIRVEGDLLIDGQMLNGNLLVGVSPETLRWMPGAQNHVFTDTNVGRVPGFVWTHVMVTGTLDSPKEDLSNRLLVAMGKAVLLDAPMEVLGTGGDVMGKTSGAALQSGEAVLHEGNEIIKGAGEAAGKGLDTLKGFIPLLPK